MKVLHLPVNIGSGPLHTVKALQKSGIDAKLFLSVYHPYQEVADEEGIHVVDRDIRHRYSPFRYWKKYSGYYYFLKYVRWADIIHWHFTTRVLPFGLDFGLIRFLKKPAIVEFHGSEVRIPEVEYQDNPYYQKAYKKESYQRSRKNQKTFADAGFEVLIDPSDMPQYLQKDIFPRPYFVPRRILLDGFSPKYPDPERTAPVIVHSPSNRPVKGTQQILDAVERLKKRHSFKFILIENKPHGECLEIIRDADIFIDQMVLGWHGMAAVEAMACGKPVVCYIKPSLLEKCPKDFPVINGTIDTLEGVLEVLIKDGLMRHRIGKEGRAYVEKYHDAAKMVPELLKVYREVIANRSGASA